MTEITEDKIIQTTINELRSSLEDMRQKRYKEAYEQIKHAIYLLSK